MRYSFAGLLLFAFSSTALAQTTVPYTFTAGTAAKASETNADFQALVTAINAGIVGYEVIRTNSTAPAGSGLSGGTTPTYSSTCPAGKRVLGGGYLIQTSQPSNSFPVASQPMNVPGKNDGTQWQIQYVNPTNAAATIQVIAICATVTGGGN
jgi:hypothetical protein